MDDQHRADQSDGERSGVELLELRSSITFHFVTPLGGSVFSAISYLADRERSEAAKAKYKFRV